jgi:hypothetical protein
MVASGKIDSVAAAFYSKRISRQSINIYTCITRPLGITNHNLYAIAVQG